MSPYAKGWSAMPRSCPSRMSDRTMFALEEANNAQVRSYQRRVAQTTLRVLPGDNNRGEWTVTLISGMTARPADGTIRGSATSSTDPPGEGRGRNRGRYDERHMPDRGLCP